MCDFVTCEGNIHTYHRSSTGLVQFIKRDIRHITLTFLSLSVGTGWINQEVAEVGAHLNTEAQK